MKTTIHENQPILNLGENLEKASAGVILLHGRGATAEMMRPLAEALSMDGIAFLIPQAAQNRWYPNSAFGPLEQNEPDLSSALAKIGLLVEDLRQNGLPAQKIVIGGFSQGACLASEYVARQAANSRLGGLFVLSGALIGPKGTPRNYLGSLEEMPVFIGSSDVDPWVSHNLVRDSVLVFERMGAEVDFRTYPGMAHTIHLDEVEAVRSLLQKVASS